MPSGRCKQCNQPLVEIDNYGERLIGCIECNRWTSRGASSRLNCRKTTWLAECFEERNGRRILRPLKVWCQKPTCSRSSQTWLFSPCSLRKMCPYFCTWDLVCGP